MGIHWDSKQRKKERKEREKERKERKKAADVDVDRDDMKVVGKVTLRQQRPASLPHSRIQPAHSFYHHRIPSLHLLFPLLLSASFHSIQSAAPPPYPYTIELRGGKDSLEATSDSYSTSAASRMSWRCSGDSNKSLVDNLAKNKIIQSQRVYDAMSAVDRGYFTLDGKGRPEYSYQDAPQPIGYGATISAPHMHAMCLELLADQLRPGSSALDVGSGSGYLVAAFAAMTGMGKEKKEESKEESPTTGSSSSSSSSSVSGGHIYGIEHIAELVTLSQDNLKKWNPHYDQFITVQKGDGRLGIPGHQFDAIHVGAAASEIPPALIDQLKPGGRLIIPVGPQAGDQYLLQIDKTANGDIKKKAVTGVRYVPLTDAKKQLGH